MSLQKEKRRGKSSDLLWSKFCKAIGPSASIGVTEYDCSYCNEVSACGGLLIRCNYKKGCQNWIHPSCAHDINGISVPDDESLEGITVTCEIHTKPVEYWYLIIDL